MPLVFCYWSQVAIQFDEVDPTLLDTFSSTSVECRPFLFFLILFAIDFSINMVISLHSHTVIFQFWNLKRIIAFQRQAMNANKTLKKVILAAFMIHRSNIVCFYLLQLRFYSRMCYDNLSFVGLKIIFSLRLVPIAVCPKIHQTTFTGISMQYQYQWVFDCLQSIKWPIF